MKLHNIKVLVDELLKTMPSDTNIELSVSADEAVTIGFVQVKSVTANAEIMMEAIRSGDFAACAQINVSPKELVLGRMIEEMSRSRFQFGSLKSFINSFKSDEADDKEQFEEDLVKMNGTTAENFAKNEEETFLAQGIPAKQIEQLETQIENKPIELKTSRIPLNTPKCNCGC